MRRFYALGFLALAAWLLMAVPTVQAVGTTADGSGTYTVVWPAHAADDIGLLFLSTRNQTPATPSGWTLLTTQGTGSGSADTSTGLWVFWKRAAGSSEADATGADPGNYWVGVIITVRGCITTGNPYDVVSGDVEAVGSTTVTVPGTTTTVNDCLVVVAASHALDGRQGLDTITSWANSDLATVTERIDISTNTGDGGGFSVMTGEKASAGSYGSSTATLSASSLQGRLSIAMKPPEGGATEKTGSDALLAGLVEAMVALVDLKDQPSDAMRAGLTESATPVAVLAVSDVLALSTAELAALLVAETRTDDLRAGLDEATVILVQAIAAELVPLGLSESAVILVSIQPTDTLSSGLSESAGLAVVVTSSDPLTIIASDSVNQVTVMVLASDPVPLGVVEAVTVAVESSTADTLTAGISEALNALMVTLSASEAPAVVVIEAATLVQTTLATVPNILLTTAVLISPMPRTAVAVPATHRSVALIGQPKQAILLTASKD